VLKYVFKSRMGKRGVYCCIVVAQNGNKRATTLNTVMKFHILQKNRELID
jgi:hypothetical protein